MAAYRLMRHKNIMSCLSGSYRSYHSVGFANKITNPCARRHPIKLLILASEKILQCASPNSSRRMCFTRCYSSESNAVENKEGQNRKDEPKPEKPLLEIKYPLLTRGERFRNEFLAKIVPWEDIDDSFDTFPYYINERDKTLLMECAASRLKHEKSARDHGGRLTSSRGRILLQTFPGAQLYREKLVRALAKELKVPLMVLDSCAIPPYDFSLDPVELESDEESDEDYSSDEDSDDEDSDDDSDDDDSDDDDDDSETSASAKPSYQLKQGDRVEFVGKSTPIEESNMTLSPGQRGEVHQVNGKKIAVVFYKSGLQTKEGGENDEKSREPLVEWLDVKHIKHVVDDQTHDCHVAIEVLCEVLESREPVIVYFPDSMWCLSRSSFWKNRRRFFKKVKETLDKLSGRMVLICGQNKWEVLGLEELEKSLKELIKGLKATDDKEAYEMRKIFTNVLRIKLPKDQDRLNTFLKQIEEDKPKVIFQSNLSKMHNVLTEHGLLYKDLERIDFDGLVLNKQKAEKIIGWATNHYLSSCPLPSMKDDRMNLPQESLRLAITRLKEEKEEKKKKKVEENKPSSTSKSPKDLASGEYERHFISAVVGPGETGVKFEDVGALEDVKKALNELVILPLKKPKLFSRGNLLRPCKGMLLFGPPGTGKSLIAKALATEAGANFINITTASLTSKWYGEEEKFTRALFSYARKLTPVVIFIDEIDSLLGARGGRSEHEATRTMRNEFMSAWDGLTSKDDERILVLGATNRPFDIDDAVIRRMPRRIYVGLPDLENRSKILKIHLGKEELEPGFDVEQLAKATEGYSGSDLKNLCVAAAYKPIQEILQIEEKTNQEKTKGASDDEAPALRPLKFDDFIQSKAQVAPSVTDNSSSLIELRKWNEQYGEGGSREKSPFGF